MSKKDRSYPIHFAFFVIKLKWSISRCLIRVSRIMFQPFCACTPLVKRDRRYQRHTAHAFFNMTSEKVLVFGYLTNAVIRKIYVLRSMARGGRSKESLGERDLTPPDDALRILGDESALRDIICSSVYVRRTCPPFYLLAVPNRRVHVRQSVLVYWGFQSQSSPSQALSIYIWMYVKVLL